MRVGQLAKKTGLTVRTLHYYEAIGLLSPARRTETGHRLYGAEEVVRLQQILSLRQLGFTLEEIRACLEQSDFSLAETLRLHLHRLEEQMEAQRRLYTRLQSLARHVESAQDVSIEEFLQTIQDMTMYEKYYTPEQLEALKSRRDLIGDEHLRMALAKWQDLFTAYRAAMESDADPCSEPVQRLVARSEALINEFTGDDPGIRKSLDTMYRTEGPEQASRNMIDPALAEYMERAARCKER